MVRYCTSLEAEPLKLLRGQLQQDKVVELRVLWYIVQLQVTCAGKQSTTAPEVIFSS